MSSRRARRLRRGARPLPPLLPSLPSPLSMLNNSRRYATPLRLPAINQSLLNSKDVLLIAKLMLHTMISNRKPASVLLSGQYCWVAYIALSKTEDFAVGSWTVYAVSKNSNSTCMGALSWHTSQQLTPSLLRLPHQAQQYLDCVLARCNTQNALYIIGIECALLFWLIYVMTAGASICQVWQAVQEQ